MGRELSQHTRVLVKAAAVTGLLPAPPTPLAAADLLETSGKRQYDRTFLLGFQFMPACIQKPEGLPPITDVVLDKVSSLVATSTSKSILMSTGAVRWALVPPSSTFSASGGTPPGGQSLLVTTGQHEAPRRC